MSYQSIVEMAGSTTLLQRIVAAAAAEGQEDPLAWAQRNVWKLVSGSDWQSAWDYAVDTRTLDHNPETGLRPGVITDQMILSAVQARRTAESTAASPPA